MKAIILAAGYSTRLYPITLDTSKSLLPIGSKVMLEWIMDRVLAIKEVDEILIVVNSKFCDQFKAWRARACPEQGGQPPIVILDDGTSSNKTRLGAVGDICLALEQLGHNDDVLILAGDNLFEGSLTALCELRREKNASVLGVHQFDRAEDVRRKFGVVVIDADNRVLEFEEKPDAPKSTLAATAIYLLRKEDLQHIVVLNRRPHSGEINAGCLVQELLTQGKEVYCSVIHSWFDVGTPEDLDRVREYYANHSN